ncbi:YeeE/YedE family protein [Aureivirga sp. CE67]|uniref:YeeE/YedE family protein n=1 Tax=Aureivirga sp. CE67 TaxID=1788983 RepID=UPI0018CA6DB3|nr:YeeE/YedE thiosulfate transporter family protein [Aureivirga sp. CE67]
MEFLLQPWPWYFAGFMIALVMFLLFYLGKRFGISSNLETMCTIAGASKFSDHFKTDVKSQQWSLIFVLGVIIGGFIAYHYMTPDKSISLNPQTVQDLQELNFQNAGATYLPSELFSLEAMLSPKGFILLLLGGFLVGFGARYAGGCTSGHAITGLSNLDILSLYAVIGFFVGGLIMIWGIFPLLF